MNPRLLLLVLAVVLFAALWNSDGNHCRVPQAARGAHPPTVAQRPITAMSRHLPRNRWECFVRAYFSRIAERLTTIEASIVGDFETGTDLPSVPIAPAEVTSAARDNRLIASNVEYGCDAEYWNMICEDDVADVFTGGEASDADHPPAIDVADSTGRVTLLGDELFADENSLSVRAPHPRDVVSEAHTIAVLNDDGSINWRIVGDAAAKRIASNVTAAASLWDSLTASAIEKLAALKLARSAATLQAEPSSPALADPRQPMILVPRISSKAGDERRIQ